MPRVSGSVINPVGRDLASMSAGTHLNPRPVNAGTASRPPWSAMDDDEDESMANLFINTQPRLRKYLGDFNDPHFIPQSPIISRQSFSQPEEEALARACADALSQTQTSDGKDEEYALREALGFIVFDPSSDKPDGRPTCGNPGSSTVKDRRPGTASQSQGVGAQEPALSSNASSHETVFSGQTATPWTTQPVTPGSCAHLNWPESNKPDVTGFPPARHLTGPPALSKPEPAYSFLDCPHDESRPARLTVGARPRSTSHSAGRVGRSPFAPSAGPAQADAPPARATLFRSKSLKAFRTNKRPPAQGATDEQHLCASADDPTPSKSKLHLLSIFGWRKAVAHSAP